jgi:hypothetical protein
LVKNDFTIYISTIAVAEFCTKDDFSNLPWEYLTPVSFELNHALRASEFAKDIWNARQDKDINLSQRKIIPNDTKLFEQADCENNISFFITADTDCKKIYEKLKPNFQFIDIRSEFDISKI